MEERTCKKCSEVKSIEEFYFTSKQLRDGTLSRKHTCRVCLAEYGRERQRANPEKERNRTKEWRKKNRFAWAVLASRGLAKKKGHLPCDATAGDLREAFTGKCHVCGIPELELTGRLCVDHDHETGDFRGWLCHACNKAAGLLKESTEIILSLAEYIEQSRVKNGS